MVSSNVCQQWATIARFSLNPAFERGRDAQPSTLAGVATSKDLLIRLETPNPSGLIAAGLGINAERSLRVALRWTGGKWWNLHHARGDLKLLASNYHIAAHRRVRMLVHAHGEALSRGVRVREDKLEDVST